MSLVRIPYATKFAVQPLTIGFIMRAIGYQQPGTIDRTEALVDIELPDPNATGRDLLV